MPQFAPHLSVLVVEDNRDISRLMVDYLEDRGHQPDSALDGLGGLHLAATQRYDAIVLDLALPGIDGLELCRRLRQDAASTVPILMLTARDTLEDKLRGFEAGADDYLIKPFDLPELEARLLALWRRAQGHTGPRLQVADLVLDTDTLTLSRGEQALVLNPLRLRILTLLMRASPRVVTRAQIEQAIWGDELTDSDALRTHISAIRQTVDKPFDDALLRTVHGVGYRLCPPNDA